MQTDYTALREYVRNWQIEHNMKLRDIEDKLEYGGQAIYHFMCGTTNSHAFAKRLADLMDVGIPYYGDKCTMGKAAAGVPASAVSDKAPIVDPGDIDLSEFELLDDGEMPF